MSQEGFHSSLEKYNEGGYFIMEPKSWPQEIQREYETHEFGQCLNVRNSFALLNGGSEKKPKQ